MSTIQKELLKMFDIIIAFNGMIHLFFNDARKSPKIFKKMLMHYNSLSYLQGICSFYYTKNIYSRCVLNQSVIQKPVA